jgi:lipase
MRLHTRAWGPTGGDHVLCIHGLAQHGGVFERLGIKLAGEGRRVTAVDLRGHGASGSEPPWNIAAHVEDLLEALDVAEAPAATLVGHSFGGLLAAALAARAPGRVKKLALLDPGMELPPEYALKAAEMDRLDWSFASVEGAANALLASEMVVSASPEEVVAFTRSNVRTGGDGRLRFAHCPSAVVTAWSEMCLPGPEPARLPTLLLRPVASPIPGLPEDKRYRAALGSLLTLKALPNGHNALWEAPAEVDAALTELLNAD